MRSKTSLLQASLASHPVAVELGSYRFVIPACPASVWIDALADEDPVTCVVPGMLGGRGYERSTRLIAQDLISLTQVRAASFAAIREASGYRWWEAMRLVGLADQDSYVVGELALLGVDPDAIPFARWCAAVHALATRNMEPKDRAKWDAKLSVPPPIEEAMEEAAEAEGSFEDMVRGFRSLPGARSGQ